MVKLVIIFTVLLHFASVNCCNPKELRRIRSLVDHLVYGIKPEENMRPTYGFDLIPIQSSEGTDCRSGGLLGRHSCLSDILCGSPKERSNYEEYVGGFLTNQDNPIQYSEGEFRNGLNQYQHPTLYVPYNQPMIHHIQ